MSGLQDGGGFWKEADPPKPGARDNKNEGTSREFNCSAFPRLPSFRYTTDGGTAEWSRPVPRLTRLSGDKASCVILSITWVWDIERCRYPWHR